MNMLLIGGSGHVSGAVCRECLRRGHDVTVLTRGRRPVDPRAKAILADRNDAAAMRAAFADPSLRFDAVIDCICYAPEDMAVMLELFRARCQQLVFVSTDFVFDPAQRRFPQPVDAPILANDDNGNQAYGFKKSLCEQLLHREAADAGLAWTVFRPCHIYGGNSRLGCFPCHCRDVDILARLQRSETITLVDGGHFLQQPILVDDLAVTIASCLGNPLAARRTFNMAGPDIVESAAYYRLIADVLGVDLRIRSTPLAEHLQLRPGDRPFLCHRIYDLADLTAAKLTPPATRLADGIRQHAQNLLAAKPA